LGQKPKTRQLAAEVQSPIGSAIWAKGLTTSFSLKVQTQERLIVSPEKFEEVEIPFEILGTTVTNKASGFSGMAVEFIRHINGCFHISIQPEGVLKATNTPICKAEFDLRECSGKMIAKMDEEQLKKSKVKNPSPTGDTFGKLLPDMSTGLRRE
jgi:hypothetical protein